MRHHRLGQFSYLFYREVMLMGSQQPGASPMIEQ